MPAGQEETTFGVAESVLGVDSEGVEDEDGDSDVDSEAGVL